MTFTALVGGFLLGFLDFVWIRFVPFPFGTLGNSVAVWAVAAFVFGYGVRSGLLRAGLGAATPLVVAVPSYYLAAVVLALPLALLGWAALALAPFGGVNQ